MNPDMGISPRKTLGIWPEKIELEEAEDEEQGEISEEEQEEEQSEWEGDWEEEEEETLESEDEQAAADVDDDQQTLEGRNEQDDKEPQFLDCILTITVGRVKRTCGVIIPNNYKAIVNHLSAHKRVDLPLDVSGCPFGDGETCISRVEPKDRLSRQVLARHIHTMHFDNKWVCDSCEYVYSREDSLKRHLKNGCRRRRRGNAD